ncbi:MAG: hypothetical protein EZS28_052519, partial [Streblomastix strix]
QFHTLPSLPIKAQQNYERQQTGLYRAVQPKILNNAPIDVTSPLSSSFAQINMQMPFFIVCRQEELWDATMRILNKGKTEIQRSSKKQMTLKQKNNHRNQILKMNDTVRMFVDQQIFGKDVGVTPAIDIDSRNTGEDLEEYSEVLQWCFIVPEDLDIDFAIDLVRRYRIECEQWQMPDFQSPELKQIVDPVLDELQRLSPIKAREALNVFGDEDRKQGVGALSLSLSCDLLSFANNMSSQHFRNTQKRIFVKNEALFYQYAPKWCINPFDTYRPSKNYSSTNDESSAEIQI